ncbi:MAG TPA: hypothetical protein VMT24_20060 [Aggregatilineaceae bacterium]|nr:hypothetical protein [Aggregatilineaceae bacterium]
MDDLYTRIVSQRGSTEKLFARLPGFRGYMELNARRQADRMMREHVADQLRQQLNRVATLEKSLLDAGGLSYMSKTRSAKTKLQTFIDRIATDAPGYSGFYDAVKIGPNDLAVIYAFDQALLDYEDKFKQKLDALQAAATKNEGIEQAIRDLDALTIEANEAYSLRENVLNKIQ